MYAAISGLSANQTMLNNTANDLANVNTVGYKSSRVTFADSLTQVLRGASGATATNGGTNALQVGLGVQVNSTDNQMSEGSFQSTNNPLDVAIQGNGFLRIGAGTPPAAAPYTSGLPANMQYTRAGNLTTNTRGFLATQAGQYVIGRNAVGTTTAAGTTYAPGATDTYIVIPPGSANVSIGQDGSVTYQDENAASPTYQQQVTAGYLSLAQFANQAGLERVGGSTWAATSNSGAAVVGTPDTGGYGQTIGGELEMSNVDLASEMTQMITAERGYQANSRVISTADQMLQTVVNMVQ
ncbi:MAG TPA: flagellar hook-basal body complex protein [Solirubrobacteraceae bacterium]|nr:flagellar hook-basal body complex protein [Solirubrobacteraceae bacterium]